MAGPRPRRGRSGTRGPIGYGRGANAFLPLAAGQGHRLLECDQPSPRVLPCQVSGHCCRLGGHRLSENAGRSGPFLFLTPQGYDTPEDPQLLHPVLLPFPGSQTFSTMIRPLPRTLLPGQPFQRASWPHLAAGHLTSTTAPRCWILLTMGCFCPGQLDASPSPCILVHPKPKLCLSRQVPAPGTGRWGCRRDQIGWTQFPNQESAEGKQRHQQAAGMGLGP